jgi:hypothetical protein
MLSGPPLRGQNKTPFEALPYSLKDSNVNPKMETMEKEGIGVRCLVRNILKVEGCARALG